MRWGVRIGFVVVWRLWSERYLLAVPSNTLIRDLETALPPYSGRGRRPNRPWQKRGDVGHGAWR